MDTQQLSKLYVDGTIEEQGADNMVMQQVVVKVEKHQGGDQTVKQQGGDQTVK